MWPLLNLFPPQKVRRAMPSWASCILNVYETCIQNLCQKCVCEAFVEVACSCVWLPLRYLCEAHLLKTVCLANCGLCAHNADGAELLKSARPQTGQSPWPPCPRPPGRLQRLSPSDTNWRTRPATQAPRAGKMPGRKSCFSRSKRKRSDTVVVFDAHERRWAARGGHKVDARSTRAWHPQKMERRDGRSAAP